MQEFIFGGDTGQDYESLQRRRKIAEAMLMRSQAGRAPRNVGEGLTAVGQALGGRLRLNNIEGQEAKGRSKANEVFQSLLNPSAPSNPSYESSGPSPQGVDAFNASLAKTESGGDYGVVNSEGYSGKYQFGQPRLDDFNRANGTSYRTADLLKSPELQESVQGWHVGDIDAYAKSNGLDRYIGQTINGVPITQNGIRAMAHLGGKGGMKQFLESGGKYNPSDSNGTSLLDYARTHGGGQATLQTASQPTSSGLPTGRLIAALSNPYLNPGQKAVLGAMLKQSQRDSDPLRQLQIQKLQNELSAGPERKIVKGADGFQYYEDNGSRVLPNVQAQPGNGEKFGKSPIYGKNSAGETVLIQAGDSGSANIMELPDGVTVSSGVSKVDVGTGTAIIDNRTGQTVGLIPKDVEGTAKARVTGKVQAEAKAKLPQAEASFTRTLKAIDELFSHPGLEPSVGTLQGHLPDAVVGAFNDDAADFRTRLSQAQGNAFLQAFQALKGGGPITEVEGLKAERAIARINTATNEKDFKAALLDFKQAVTDGYKALQREAGGEAPEAPAQAPQNSAQPSVDDLLKKYGQ